MTNIISTSPLPVSPTFSALGFGLPYAAGITLIHNFTAANANAGTGVVKNLAYSGAPPSTIAGAPVFDGSTIAFNHVGVDSLVSLVAPGTGDETLYVVGLNTDTLASGSTQPIFASTYSGPHGGLSIGANSTTAMRGVDYGLVGGTLTGNPELITVPNIATAWKMYALSTTLSASNLITTFYDLTDNLTTPSTLASVTARSAGTPTLHIGSRGDISSGSGGNCKVAFVAYAQTAAGGGGLHNAGQIAANAATIRAFLATLPTPITTA